MAGSLVAGRFQIGARVGAGSAAEVYRATDLRTGGEVAVKLDSGRFARDDTRRRFEREAAALSVLASPHVVELIAAGEREDGRSYLVLELLRGRTLQQQLDETGPIAPIDLLGWFAQAAAAVELAHGVGIVHRDLKPPNLFLHEPAGGGRLLKVLDFGLVTDVADRPSQQPGEFAGTPLYMAPEQVRGQTARIGPATDVWGMGMLAVTLLTAEAYWSATSVDDVIADIEGSPLYPPSTRWPWLPRAFDAWFARSTQRVPEKRWHSVAEQAAALHSALRSAIGPAGAPGRRRGRIHEASTVQARTPTPALVRETFGDRPLVGRRAELGALEERLVAGAIVTLTGPGGVGKSRLAEAVCVTLGERLPDGAWLVPLGATTDPAAIPDAIANALGLGHEAAQPMIDRVASALAPMRAVIALDGFEHLLEGRDQVAELARRAPRVAWLVTSRLPLGLRGEERVLVEPLEVPPASVSPVEAASYVAVELFVARAREADPGFALDARNCAEVVALCRLAEGVPLAIELAAAQVRARPLGEIGAHLEAAGGDAVRGAVTWCYGLLDEPARALLRRLALFPAGATLRDARERLGELATDFTGSMERLVDSHLLGIAAGDPPRLTMLETVRDFCRAESAALGEEGELWREALAYLVGFVERAGEGVHGHEQSVWLARLDAEHDNLVAALAYALERAPAAAMRLANGLAWYWYLRGHYDEGSRWLEGALDRASPERDQHRLRALVGAGRLALLRCRYARAEELLAEARDLAVALRDGRVEADAEQLLGSVARERGDYGTARRRHQRSLARWRELGDRREAARALNYLTFLAWIAGDPDAADPGWRDRAGDEFASLGDREGLVWSLLNQGAIAHHAGDDATARTALGRAFAEAVAVRYQEGIAWSLNLSGLASLARGERVQALAQLRASLRVHRRLGDLWRYASVLDPLGVLAVAEHEVPRAAALFGCAAAIRSRIGVPVPACERALRERGVGAGVSFAGDAFTETIAERASLPLEEAVALAMGAASW